ncbi:MAG: hypothetical protein N3C12_03385 [Candidatus Binatia bacterium]|nr:hypothetical protein [Candidatus Binatia bacterium]
MLQLVGSVIALALAIVSVSPWVQSVMASLGLAVLALGLATLSAPGQAEFETKPRWLPWCGLIAALAVALWFRVQHWKTVPAGYLGEVLNFVNFAAQLRERGFPYEPYAWYAHTLFSYVIAVVGVFVPDNLVALRIAQQLISMATVTAIAWCSWILFGSTTAWMTAAFVATSWWHLWATRNGYHQFLTPLFQALVVGGLIRGLRDKRKSGLALAALGIAGGLHAYWALYLMVPAAVLVTALFFWQRPEEWKRLRFAVAVAAVAAVALSVPAVVVTARAPEGFSYVFGGLQPVRVGAESVGEKAARNASFLQQAFFPQARQANLPPTLVDSLVRGGLVLGMGAALRRALFEPSSAAILVVLGINLFGLIAAITNEFYVIAVFLPAFVLAGYGYASLLQLARSNSRVLGWVVAASFLASWIYFGQASVKKFFGTWAYSMFRSPQHPQGLAFLLLPHWQRCVREASCLVPGNEPGRDFEGEALSLGVTLPAYRWLHGLGSLLSDLVLFPPIRLISGRPLRLILPDLPYVTDRLLPDWRRFYAQLTARKIPAPPPWDQREPRELALEVEIPWTDLEQRFVSPFSAAERATVFWSPAAGRYEFRRFVPSVTSPPSAGTLGSEGPAFLESGYYQIVLDDFGWTWTGWQVRRPGMDWEAIDHYLVTVEKPAIASVLAPYLRKMARPSANEWRLRNQLTVPGLIWDMALCPDQSLVSLIRNQIYRIDLNSGEARELGQVSLPDPALRCTADGIDLVGRDGRWLRWSAENIRDVSQIPCAVRALAKAEGPLTALCDNSNLWLEGGAQLELRNRLGRPLRRPVAVERCGTHIHVLDSDLAELLTYTPAGQLVTTKLLPSVWWESELTCDEEQNLFVLKWRTGRPAYNPDGEPLFHPEFHLLGLFRRKHEGFNGFGFRLFVARGRLAAWTRDNEVEVLERVAVGQPES